MASERSIDVDALLEPVPGDSPAGVDAREDAAAVDDFYEVKDARAEARSAERHAFETLEDAAEAASVLGGLAGQWAAVSEGAQRLLAERTKDLEIASWLTEALVRRHGFAGLRDGFDVMTGLVEGFWDGLHPRPDEELVRAWLILFRLSAYFFLRSDGQTSFSPTQTLSTSGTSRSRVIR